MAHRKKSHIELTRAENVARIRLEMRLASKRALNEAETEMLDQFDEALNRGELLSIPGSASEMREYLRVASEKSFGATKAKRAIG